MRVFKSFKKNLIEFVLVAVMLSFFLCASLSYLSLPGFGRDEAITPTFALGLLVGDSKLGLTDNISPVTLDILVKKDFSFSRLMKSFSFSNLMVDFRMSAIFGWLYAFVFLFFDYNVYIVRFVSIFFCLIFLLFFYFFVRSFFNRQIALFSLILISTLPDLIFYSRISINFNFILVPVFGSLLFFLRFYKRRRLVDLGIGSLWLGFFYNLKFLWFFFALIITLFLLGVRFHFKKRELLIGFLFFLLGILPAALWNLSVPFEQGTIDNALTNFIVPLAGEKSHSEFITYFYKEVIGVRMRDRFFQIFKLLGHNGWFFLIACILSFAGIILGDKEKKKRELFILIITLILFLEISVLVWNTAGYQILILIPFFIILLANLFNCLYKYSKILTFFLLGFIVISNLSVFINSFDSFTSGYFFPDNPSGNIYRLVEYLQENEIYRPVPITWDVKSGIESNLAFLSSWKVIPHDLGLFKYGKGHIEYDKIGFIEKLKNEFSFQDNIFILRDSMLSPNITDVVVDAIEDLNKTMVVNKTFYSKDGRLEYLLFQIKGP